MGIQQLHALSVHQGGPAHRGPCTKDTPVPRSSCWWRRSERSPSRTADRSGSERSVLPCAGACSPPGTASPSTERGRLASCPSSLSLVSSSLCLARARADVERRMRSADWSVRSKLFEAACKTVLTLDRHFVCDVICKLIFVYNELEEKRLKSSQCSASWCSYSWQSSSSLAGVLSGSWCVGVLTNET